MATAITHLVFADQLYTKYFSKFAKPAFFFGVNFPDIRMTTDRRRGETHYNVTSLTEIINTDDPLTAGSKFHCLTDQFRTKFYQPRDSYLARYFDELFFGAALKFLEDEYCYNQSRNWADYVNYYRDPEAFNLPTGYSQEQIQQYGQIVANYIEQPPNPTTRQRFILKLGFKLTDYQNNERTMSLLRQDQQVQKYISELFSEISEIIN